MVSPAAHARKPVPRWLWIVLACVVGFLVVLVALLTWINAAGEPAHRAIAAQVPPAAAPSPPTPPRALNLTTNELLGGMNVAWRALGQDGALRTYSEDLHPAATGGGRTVRAAVNGAAVNLVIEERPDGRVVQASLHLRTSDQDAEAAGLAAVALIMTTEPEHPDPAVLLEQINEGVPRWERQGRRGWGDTCFLLTPGQPQATFAARPSPCF